MEKLFERFFISNKHSSNIQRIYNQQHKGIYVFKFLELSLFLYFELFLSQVALERLFPALFPNRKM